MINVDNIYFFIKYKSIFEFISSDDYIILDYYYTLFQEINVIIIYNPSLNKQKTN